MKKVNTIFKMTLVLLCVSMYAGAQSLSLLTKTSGISDERVRVVTTDGTGNTIYTGTYQDVTVVEGVTIQPLGGPMAPPFYSDTYIAKHSSNGASDWVIAIGGPSLLFSNISSLVTDANDNILFVLSCVILADSIHIGNVFSVPAGGAQSTTILAKLDPQGNLIWSKVLSNDPTNAVLSSLRLGLDAQDNFYLGGFIAGTLSVDTFQLSAIGASPGNFVLKGDANGNILWTKGFGSKAADSQFLNMKVNDQDEVFFTSGWGGDTLFMDNLTLVNPNAGGGNMDRFIAKIDASGNSQWLVREGGLDVQNGGQIETMANGGVVVYSVVDAASSIDIDGGNTNVAGPVLLYTKYNSAGMLSSYMAHANNAGLVNSQFASDGENLYTSVTYNGAQFTVGSATVTNAGGTNGSSDIAIIQMDSAANITWSGNIGSVENENGQALSYSQSTSQLMIGGATTASQLIFGDDTLMNTGTLTDDAFITTLSNSIGLSEYGGIKQLAVYPNPASQAVHFSLADFNNNTVELTVVNALGQMITKKIISSDQSEFILDVNDFNTGIYFINLTDGTSAYTGRFIKQ